MKMFMQRQFDYIPENITNPNTEIIRYPEIWRPMNILEVNHITGEKDDNDIGNLEWCTRSQNNHHTYLLGSNSQFGTNNSNAKFNEADVIQVCKLREQGLSIMEIADNMDLDYDKTKRRIGHIVHKENWLHISSQYNF